MYEEIPTELLERNSWVCWSLEKDSTGRKTKRPINPHTGTYAKSNDSNTWADYATALEMSKNFDGIGFMLGDGIFGIDIDGVEEEIKEYLSNDEVDNIVGEFIETMQSYSEISPSGKGIHIIAKGELPEGGRRRGNVEMYSELRFLTFTGFRIGRFTEIEEDELGKISFLHNKYIMKPETEKQTQNLTKGFGNDLGIEQIIDTAKKSKNGLRFSTLFEGDWSQFYDSQSEADMAFTSDLAFWTARDPYKMDTIFRKSVLYRDKWDEQRGDDTYGNLTISKAIESCQNEFIPETTDTDFQIYIMDDAVKPAKKDKRYSYDDTGNAERLKDLFGDNIRYNYTSNAWMYYDGKRWKHDDTGKMKILADKVVNNMKNEKLFIAEGVDEEEMKKFKHRHWKDSRNHNKKVNMMKECEHLLPVQNNDFDKDFNLFNVQNGYIDLRSGQLIDHDRNNFFTKISNVEFTDKADCPKWEEFLNDIFLGRQDLINFIQRAVGYSLSGYTTEQVLFVLHGNGRNGKSVFIEVLNEIFGNYATNITPQAIMASKMGNNSGPTPEIAKLDGARFVTTTEPNEGDRFDEGLLKQITGGDKISARKLHENSFEFTPQLKLWMATNHKPYVRGRDEGIWRRFVIIPFEKQIPLNEIDKDLTKKLKQELPAIIKWCVDGYLEWQRIGLSEPAIIKEQRDEYRTEMDSIAAFIDECCEVGTTGKIKSSLMFAAYDEWARENNQYRMTNTKFGIEMSKKFKKITSNGVHYIGVGLLDDYNPNKIQLKL
ncbi:MULTISPECIES: phage/plasmid primase, P4 family [unclassified Mammaliicoccus]|uniref:phage/plasmid primase, P4 family n=1 Tax=unclassified Mammaliicoccus TaxID=2803851 RepID=UPI001EFB86BF|nr:MULTISPECIES: phage/plasmid primase, P4 family [unclassified Mammaliicoccus]